MAAFFLSESQVNLLQELVDQSKGRLNNPQGIPPTDHTYNRKESPQAPEVYIAKPQTVAGIPKLLSSGTGTGTDVSGSVYDEPGSAECDIYKIVIDATTGDPELQSMSLAKLVYNLSASDIAQGWITVIRTKGGKWVAVTAEGSSGSETITVVTNIRVDTTTLKIQKKTRQIQVTPIAAESDWIDVHTGVNCSATGTGS